MKDIELPPLPEPTALGMDFDKGWDGVRAYGYTEEDMASYARAAVEADRAQSVPEIDYEALIHAGWKNHKYAQGTRGCVAFKHGAEWFRSVLLASTPAQPAQKPATSVPWMTARRAAYFMERFLHEEKMLGPNEQDALRFTIEALEAMATTHQEPPQQERKPMTEEQVYAMCDRLGLAQLSPLDLVAEVERHHGIKE